LKRYSAIIFKTVVNIQTAQYVYTWLLPAGLPGSKNCFIRVTLNGTRTAISEWFTISAKPVVTFAPFNKPVVRISLLAFNTALPAGATYSGKGVNAGYFNPSVAGVGKHMLTYSYTDTVSGCSNSDSQEIIMDICTALNTSDEETAWNIYPNPTLDVIHLDYQAGGATSLTIRLTNGAGQTIYIWKPIRTSKAGTINRSA
jgi:hypothetical protein